MDPTPISVRPFEAPFVGAHRIHTFLGIPPTKVATEAITWIGAAKASGGIDVVGVTAGGTRVDELLRAEPIGWLGPDFDRFGPDPAFVVKLIDAGQRLMLHVHPDESFAKRHLGDGGGMAEAWVILDADPGAVVHLGFRREVQADELRDWVSRQDIARMLSETNEVEVAPGDIVFVPPGIPHAVGQGILLAEVQQPADRMVFLEWKGFPIEPAASGQLGLESQVVLQCVDRRRLSAEALFTRSRSDDRRGQASPNLLVQEADRYFAIEQLKPGVAHEPAYSVLLVTGGEGLLTAAGAFSRDVARGDALLVPFAAGSIRLQGDVSALRFRAPSVRATATKSKGEG